MAHLNRKTEDAASAAGAAARSIALRLEEGLRGGTAALGDLADRALHSRRRASARQRIAAMAPMRSALFVCHGNVCRSPFAAAVFARSMRNRWDVQLTIRSAGFVGPRRPPPIAALEAALRRQIDLSAHRSTVIMTRTVNSADLVVVMAADQAEGLRQRFGTIRGTLVVLGDFDPGNIRRRTIIDPWGHDDAVFDESYDRIERCITELARSLVDARKPSDRR